jgi:hypothetical protein
MEHRFSGARSKPGLILAGAAVLLLITATLRPQGTEPVLRAYPERIDPDLTFEAVVSSQPFPPVKYPVPVIGWKEHPEEIHVAPNGALVFPAAELPGGLCLLPRVQVGPAGPLELLSPDAVAQGLIDGYLPGVRSEWKVRGMVVAELAFATLIEAPVVRTGRETLVAVTRWTVKNGSGREEPVRLAFTAGQAASGQSLFKMPPAFPAPLTFKRPFVLLPDGRILMRVGVAGASVAFRPAPGAGGTGAEPGPGNELLVDFRLKPGETRTIDLFVPYVPARVEKTGVMERLAVGPQLEVFRNFWTRELNRRAQFIVPEKMVRDSYRASLAYNMILVDRDAQGHSRPHPDPTAYEHVWAGDSGCIIHAADRLGYHEEAAAYLDYFLSRQGVRAPEGEVASADGFLSGDVSGLRWMGENGFILWALAEHYKLTGDKVWLRKVAPRMVKSCDWIVRERARTKTAGAAERPRHYGLLPKGRASDNAELNYFYWTDTYSYAGLRGTADVLPEIGMAKEAARLRAEADDYRACILDSVERSIVRTTDPPFVPQGPYMNRPPAAADLAASWYSLCSPIYMVEMDLFGAADQKAGWINRTIEKFVMTSGLPTLVRPGTIDPHYVYNQALSQLLRGETDKFLWTFYSVFAYGQARATYATLETNDIATGSSGEAWDSLRMPHMHSGSRVLALLRIALLLEDGNTLHLLAGTPRGWLEAGKTIEVRDAPSRFGEVDFRCESRPSGNEIVATIAPPAREPARIVLHVRPPSKNGPLKAVTVNGRPWAEFKGEAIDLGRLSTRAVVVCRY